MSLSRPCVMDLSYHAPSYRWPGRRVLEFVTPMRHSTWAVPAASWCALCWCALCGQCGTVAVVVVPLGRYCRMQWVSSAAMHGVLLVC